MKDVIAVLAIIVIAGLVIGLLITLLSAISGNPTGFLLLIIPIVIVLLTSSSKESINQQNNKPN